MSIRTALRRTLDLGTLARHDRACLRAGWGEARTVADLGELTARWLEGAIPVVPSFGSGSDPRPDEETEPLIPVLAAANRAGYVTSQSQPGYHSPTGQQRAAVEGFVDDPVVLARLGDLAERYRIRITVDPIGRHRSYHRAIPVSRCQDQVYTEFGGVMSRRDVAFLYGICGDEAVEALQNAWQVTLVDPVWGRQDVLPAMLAEFAERVAV